MFSIYNSEFWFEYKFNFLAAFEGRIRAAISPQHYWRRPTVQGEVVIILPSARAVIVVIRDLIINTNKLRMSCLVQTDWSSPLTPPPTSC